jgi:hypothetical protein
MRVPQQETRTKMKAETPTPVHAPIRRRTLLMSAIAGAALSACGGHSSSTSASIRLVNATLSHSSLDLWVNGSVAQSGVPLDGTSAYVGVAATGTALQVDDAGSSASLTAVTPTLTSDAHNALLAFESEGTVTVTVIDEEFPTPAAGAANLRVADYVPEAGKLDVYVTSTPIANAAAIATLSPQGSLVPTSTGAVISLTFGPGNYFATFTPSGNASDIRLLNMPITLASQQVASIILTPAAGGLLLNGGLLVQQGAYTAFRNDSVRLRLASAVTGNATIAASAASGGGTVVIDGGSVSPQFGTYVLAPANSTLQITVNGTPIAPPSGTLAKGGDYTILISGSPTDAVATLIADDNRPAADTGAAKLRLINGISGNASNLLTLTINSITVASSVAPDSASGYATVTGSTNLVNVDLYSNQKAGVYYADSSFVFNAGGVFTVFAVGDFSSPFLLVR